MKTAVVTVLASFCVVTGVLADDSCKVQAEGKNLRRGNDQFHEKVLQRPSLRAKTSRGSEDELHQEMLVRRRWHVKRRSVRFTSNRDAPLARPAQAG
jgi:hypothetical protein